MKLKISLAGATAMGLLMGAAIAGDVNNSFVAQQGKYNEAYINQSGGSNNKAGSDTQSIQQIRNDSNSDTKKSNRLNIVQSGSNNAIGLGGNGNSFGHASGIHQNESYAGGSTYAAARNTIDITQSSDGNTVGAVSQRSATHVGNNALVILQNGVGNNKVGSVSQYRTQTTQNVTDIEQGGEDNTIARVEQYVTAYGGADAASVNMLNVTITGTENGNGAFTAGGAADISGAQSSTLIQGKSGNAARDSTIRLTLSGNSNEFGVSQYGFGNSVGQLTVSGNDNEFGIYQDGSTNVVALGVIEGDENNIGISQIGTNTATVNVLGVGSDGNGVSVSQEGTNTATANITGSTNDVTLVQGYNLGMGGVNTAALTINGDSNRLNAEQLGSNTLAVNVWGSNNNSAANFDGVAANAAGLLVPGDLLQKGAGNTATIDVGTSLSAADGNRFAFNQNGINNSLTGTVNGSGNQAAIVQTGDTNVASFVQTGGMNQLGVTQ